MKRLYVFLLLAFCLVVAVPAQKKTNAQRRVTTTKRVQKKQPAKKQPAKKQATKKQSAKNEQPVTVKIMMIIFLLVAGVAKADERAGA